MPPHSDSPLSPSGKAFSEGSPDAPHRVIIFHGYTGSPDEYREVAKQFAQELEALVRVPLLPGHGTKVEDLLHVRFDDLLQAARREVAEIAKEGKPFVICGNSFGGFLALLAASEFTPKAVVVTVIPYSLPFPLWIPGMAWFLRVKRFWKKKFTPKELEARKNIFYYKSMPSIALSFIHEARRHVDTILPRLAMPILAINTDADSVALPSSGRDLLDKTGGNGKNRNLVLAQHSHRVFYGPGSEEAVAAITTFLKRAFEIE